MAHLVTGYAGYAHIKSADEGAFNASFFGDGQYVMEYGNCMEGSIIDNNTIRIQEGDGLMYGRHFRIEAAEDVTIDTGTAGTNRIDLICMTYEKNTDDETEKVYLQVIKGTQTEGTAAVPEYIDGNILNGASFNQMPLYKVKINGVVLTSIESLITKLPSYQALAEIYEAKFMAACEELKEQFALTNIIKKTDVVDNLTSTSTDLPLSARAGNELNGKVEVIEGSISDIDSTYPIGSYQLFKIGRLVVFNVSNYKKASGRISSRKVCKIPEGFRPAVQVVFPFSTSGAVTDTSSNPGSQLVIRTDGEVNITCNFDTGNYAAWSACWIINI